MCKTVLLPVLTLVFLSAQAADATAQLTRVVSASFFDIAIASSGPMLSTSYAGVPPSQYSVPTNIQVSNWNNLPLQFLSVPGSNLDLIDSQGNFTSVDVDWIATDVIVGSWAGGISAGDSTMMNGAIQSSLRAPTDKIEINVHDLASSFDLSAGYDVIIYADQDGTGAQQSFFVDDGFTLGSAITMQDVVSYGPFPRVFDPAVDYDEGTTDGAGTWIRFSGLSGPSFTIEALAVNNWPAFINGFQIVGYQPIGVPPTGDFDGDGFVTGADFLVWQRGIGSGIYTDLDLKHWQANYGQPTPIMSVTQAVPEPSVGVLLVASIVTLGASVRYPHSRGRKRANI